MAPKTRGASNVQMKRKRTVRRPPREPTPESSSATSSDDIRATTSTTPQVDLFSSRVITTGRKFDFDLFERENFLVGRQLKEMGFEKLCSLDCPTYPNLVKEFYKNLTRGDNGLVSVVRGVGLNVTGVILSRLLDLPLSGPSTYNPEDRSPALTRLLNRDFEEFEEVFANQLPLDLRLLHNICSRILFPKTGRFDYVSERDIFVMDAVVSGKPINLPTMIIWYMADCGSKKKASLPYGMILTQIFRSQGILISDSEPSRELRHTDYYSLATVHRMGFRKVNGVWIRRGQDEARVEDSAAAEVETGPTYAGPSAPGHPVASSAGPSEAGPSIPTPPPSSDQRFSDAQLDQLRELLVSQEERIKTELKTELEDKFLSIRALVYSLDDRISHLESSFDGSFVKDQMTAIFEKLKDIGGDSDIYSKGNAELQDKILTASKFIEQQLNNFFKIQKDGMGQILEELKRVIR